MGGATHAHGLDAWTTDPIGAVEAWVRAAEAAGAPEPTAMALATVDEHGAPDVRMVLCKGIDVTAGRVRFYTGLDSAKGRQLAQQPHAAVAMWWPQLHAQVRMRGPVELVSRGDVDAYFATRPEPSRAGAHATRQSQPLERREQLDTAVAEARRDPRLLDRAPERWGGYDIVVRSLELWLSREGRLHERVAYAYPADAPSAWGDIGDVVDDPAGRSWRRVALQP